MRKILSLLMGVNECASPIELRKQFQRLTTALIAAEGECNPDQAQRYQTARERLSVAYEKAKRQLTNPEEMHGSVTGCGILLGEILIDSRLITHAQLDDALAAQAKTKPPLPLGRILVARKLITWEQLAYFLKLQDLLQLPAIHQERLARQLTELGLCSKAEMEIAELDCETTGWSMFHAIGRRGWIKPALLAALTNTVEKTAPKPGAEESTPATSGKTLTSV
jgi:hypothetical protein